MVEEHLVGIGTSLLHPPHVLLCRASKHAVVRNSKFGTQGATAWSEVVVVVVVVVFGIGLIDGQ